MASRIERLKAATHAYVGRCRCGSAVAVCVDTQDNETAKDVSGFVRRGYTVDRVLIADIHNGRIRFEQCRCGGAPTKQGDLFAAHPTDWSDSDGE